MDVIIIIFAALLFLFTLLSVTRHQYWVFRVFDYPRVQKLVLSGVCLLLVIAFYRGTATLYWILLAGLVANIIYLGSQVVPFTPLGKKQVLRATTDIPDQSICVMISNVFEDNRNSAGCLREIYKHDPDVVLLLETSHWWDEQTQELANKYPFSVKKPIDNTYGMLLYSKLPLQDAEIKFLVEKDIPSIHTVVVLKSGKKIRLFCVHPTPPVPNENPTSKERDKELLMIADLAKTSELPVIVVGDLNDVAWSYTTELFLKMSGLIDPRRGRGFYNSFHAHYPFLRFPLDHAFISTDFKLKGMRRLNNFNSDHFPIYIHLQHEPRAAEQQESMQPDEEDLEIAAEKKAAV